MARLFGGEKEHNADHVLRLLQRCFNGLSESEAAEELGWDRRTTNNYLRELRDQGRIYKEGRTWHSEE